MDRRLVALASRAILARTTRSAVLVASAVALLALLVDGVELGARSAPGGPAGAAPVLEALREAVLLLPGHLGQAAPLVAALGAAFAVSWMRRTGEWLALQAAGISPGRRLAPVLVLGLLLGAGGAALDGWAAPWGERTRADLAARSRGVARVGDAAWLTAGDVVFEVTVAPHGDRIAAARAFDVRGGRLTGTWAARDLTWDGRRWVPAGGGDGLAPWTALPPPALLRERLGALSVRARTWRSLAADPSPEAAAERHARWSRAAACGPAALVGAAVPALLGPGSLAVLAAATPVLAWEALAIGAQAQAAAGHLPPWSPALARLGAALLLAASLVRRLGRV